MTDHHLANQITALSATMLNFILLLLWQTTLVETPHVTTSPRALVTPGSFYLCSSPSKMCMDLTGTPHWIYTEFNCPTSAPSPDLMLPSSRQIPFQRVYRDELCMLSLTCFTSSCFCRIFSQFRTKNTWCFSTKFLQELGFHSRIYFYWKNQLIN